jgi:hypothetical protein
VNLQPDEYIVFRDRQSNAVVWTYESDPALRALNRVHLPSLYFTFDGTVHKITDGTKAIDDVIILKNDPQVSRRPLSLCTFDFCIVFHRFKTCHLQ